MPSSGSHDAGPHGGNATRSLARDAVRQFLFAVLVVAVSAAAIAGALQARHALRGGEGCYWTNGQDRLQSTARELSRIEGARGVSLDDSNCRVGGKGVARVAFPGVSAKALDARLGVARSCGANSDYVCSVNGINVSVAVLDEELRIVLGS